MGEMQISRHLPFYNVNSSLQEVQLVSLHVIQPKPHIVHIPSIGDNPEAH